jgi:hypothetical protein
MGLLRHKAHTIQYLRFGLQYAIDHGQAHDDPEGLGAGNRRRLHELLAAGPHQLQAFPRDVHRLLLRRLDRLLDRLPGDPRRLLLRALQLLPDAEEPDAGRVRGGRHRRCGGQQEESGRAPVKPRGRRDAAAAGGGRGDVDPDAAGGGGEDGHGGGAERCGR